MFNRKLFFAAIKWIFAFAIIASLVLFLRHSEIDKIGFYLRQIGANFLIIIAITFIAQIMGTLGWLYCFPKNKLTISFYRLFSIRLIGENIGIINPSSIVGGDGFKSYLLHKEGIKAADSLSSLLISRATMISTQVGMFIIAAIVYSIFVSPSHRLGNIIALSIGILLVLTILIIALFKKKNSNRWQRIFGSKRFTSIQEIFLNIQCYYIKSPDRFYLSALFSSFNWIIGSLEIFLIFHFLGVDISLIASLLVDQGVLVLKSFGAFIPGQLGVEEYANKVMFSIVGIVSIEVWIAASLLRRARQLFWIAVSAILYLTIKQEFKPRLSFI